MTVCVTGVPCCGSSATAHVLDLVGVSLGDPEPSARPVHHDETRCSESHPFRELDAELLVHLGGAWDQPPVLDPGWERDARLDPFRFRAAGLLEDVFGSSAPRSGVIGWEDPLLALLLPFWRTVTSIDTTIVLVRDPAEIAGSLLARYAIDAPQAALLWLRYLLSATANDPGHLLIRCNELITDPPAMLAAIARHLDLPVPDSVLEVPVREHLDPRPRREVAPTTVPPGDGNPLVALARAVWNQGAIDIALVPPIFADGIRRGRLRPPVDGELLARARAHVMRLRERVRRQRRDEAARECTINDGGKRG
ncbi:MAG: hypothetical protein ACRDY6_11125 [Acidimicrobiia bacterium]